jgi:hypothetical protein
MRKALMAAILAAGFAVPASAESKVSLRGIVTAVDNGAKTFVCHWKTSDWTYKTTAKTVFHLAKKPADFSDLKAGQTVQVKYHVVGKDWIADRVAITIGTGF